jgi:hypothetical protein
MRNLCLQQIPELGWTATGRLGAELGKSLADLRLCEAPVDRFIQLYDDLSRRAAFHAEANPILDHEIGKTLLDDRWDALQRCDPLWPRYGEGSQLASSDEVNNWKGRDEGVLRRLRKSGRPEDRLAHETKRFEKILAETRKRGYALRDSGYVGGFYGTSPRDDGLAAIALPLLDRKSLHGAINILWVKTAFSIEDFASRYLGDLQAAAYEIVSSLHQAPSQTR